MRGEIEERTVRIAEYIAEKRCTVRQAAAVFCISKSTVHKDISERLPHVNRALSEDVRKILDENKSERHIRGGIATREKNLKIKKAKKNQ